MNTGNRPRIIPTIRGLKRWLRDESVLFLHPREVVRGYGPADLRPDLLAGLTIAVVLLPQAIAYAMIAELPPQTGLYAAVMGAITGALWGSSRHLHTGPTNASSLLVLASLLTVATPGTPQFLAAAGYMALLVGAMKLAMGLLRMGVLVNFVADSVVLGFTAGAGVLISCNQLRHLLRLDVPSTPELGRTLSLVARALGETHLISLGVGLGTMVVIVLLRRFRPGWPAALTGMTAAAAATGTLKLHEKGVEVLGALPRSLPPLADLPLLDFDLIWNLVPGALAVSAIGLVEAISSARSIAARSGDRLDSNQEFVGQGVASLAAGLFSGYAVSGSFTRSAVGYEAGGRTAMASVFSGLWVMIALLFLAPLAVYLPRAALAGVLLVTAWGMADRREMKRILQTSRGDSSILIATLAATLLLPLEFAVLSGMLVSFARYLIKTSTPGVYPVVPDENFRHFVRAGRGAVVCPQMGVIEIEGSLYFGAVHHVEEALRTNQERNPEQTFLLLRMHMVDHCDVSGIHMLEAVVKRYRRFGGDVFLDGVRPGVHHMIHLYGFDRMLGAGNILESDDPIGHMFHKVLHPGFCIYTCPHRVFAECQALPKETVAEGAPHAAEVPTHEVEDLTPTALKLLMDDPTTPLTLIDVGEPGEFRGWHIHGARSLPVRMLIKEKEALLAEDTLVFVSRIGRRSALAAMMVQDMGHERVFHLRGGMLAWEAARLPKAVE